RRGAGGRLVPPGPAAAPGLFVAPQDPAALVAGSPRPRRRLGHLAIARKSIVTRTGDGGETGLLYGGRVAKTDPRTEAYGDVDEAEIADLEGRITLPDAFVIPGGTQPAAALDLARAIVRRAERRIVGLQQSGHLLNAEVLRYVNRLSDLLFMLARAEEGTTVK